MWESTPPATCEHSRAAPSVTREGNPHKNPHAGTLTSNFQPPELSETHVSAMEAPSLWCVLWRQADRHGLFCPPRDRELTDSGQWGGKGHRIDAAFGWHAASSVAMSSAAPGCSQALGRREGRAGGITPCCDVIISCVLVHVSPGSPLSAATAILTE